MVRNKRITQRTLSGVYDDCAASTTTGSGVGGALRNVETMRTVPCTTAWTFSKHTRRPEKAAPLQQLTSQRV